MKTETSRGIPASRYRHTTLTVEAQKNGYQIARQTVQVDYTNAEANIE
jgi:hypothetical protein